RQLWADLPRGHLLRREGRAELPRAIGVERRDLNGDGRAEWFVVGTRACGAANCPRWIYRELPGGQFQQVFDGAGARIDVLPERTNGWPALVSVGHMSANETVFRRSRFDGRRYVWHDTEYREQARGRAARTIYHVSLLDADPHGVRRLVLEPVHAGGGLWISARHEVCPGAERCAEPRLVLRSASLPEGRVCVRFRSAESDPAYASAAGDRWCGVTNPAVLPDNRRARQLVVYPTRRDWAQLGVAHDVILTAPGLPGKLETDAVGALMSFSDSLRDLYSLPCVPGHECLS
ncbi:MAG TPA: hypothetical protein VJT67_10475, partial [Longimicrobiaceae bacterium]|nr:hypothetical protein [Longimicrobiaceae bacterium]